MSQHSKAKRGGVTLFISLLVLAGCERRDSPAPMPQSQLMSALELVEWDLSGHVGHAIRIEGVGPANGKCEITAIKEGTRLVTQISPAEGGVLVYVIDSSGTSSTKINVDPATTALRRSREDGILYEENGTPVVTLTRSGT